MRCALLVLVLTSGCDGDPTCKQALSNVADVLDLRRSEITREIGVCEQESWPAEARRCLFEARTRDALARCPQRGGRGGGDKVDRDAERDSAFGSYMKKAKKSEAVIQLDKIGKSAVIEYTTNAVYPAVSASLTPAVNCCTQNFAGKKKCEAVRADWETPGWRALDFSVEKEFYFQYSYEALKGGTEFVARATGDLDCDGTTVTYELRGTSVGGTPRTVLTEPPPSSD